MVVKKINLWGDYLSNMKLNISNVGLIWLLGSGFYLTQIVSVSPVYFIFIACTLCALVNLFGSNFKIQANSYQIILYVLLPLVSLFPGSRSEINLTINAIVLMASPMLVIILFRRAEISQTKISIIIFLYSLLFIVDGVWRILHPNYEFIEQWAEAGIGFYIYKSASIMYNDSNFLGLQALIFYCFYRYMNASGYCRSNVVHGLLLIGILLSFSRSSIVAAIFANLAYFLVTRNSRNVKFYLIFLSPILFALFFYVVYLGFSDDASFMSKFDIIFRALDAFSHLDLLDSLIGVGFGNAPKFIGIGAHNFYVVTLLEGGTVFSGFLLIFIVNIVYMTGKMSWVLVVPILIAFFSLGSISIPYMTTLFMIAGMISRNRIQIY